jgi:hypothetical protein
MTADPAKPAARFQLGAIIRGLTNRVLSSMGTFVRIMQNTLV